jgi:fatty acid desaturase
MLERVSSTDSATMEASPAPDSFPRGYYHDHLEGLPKRLREAVPHDELRELHARSGWRHLLIAGRQAALYLVCLWGMITYDQPWIWIPLAALQGVVILSFIILLHEVVHDSVFREQRSWPLLQRFLGLCYALPSAIAASQFTRWHLDHHRELGSTTEDPKRAYLSPKRNARWYKALYMTAALFVIYAKAAAQAAKGYEPALRRTITLERLTNIALHAALAAAIWHWFGGEAVLRAYVVPLFVFFPPAFMLNRLGQHYWVDPSDPAKWSTRVDGSPLVNFLFLHSNHHIEHHYFPRVPLYRLRRLNRDLRPFWKEIGHANRSYPALVWGWFARNGAPHTDWTDLA